MASTDPALSKKKLVQDGYDKMAAEYTAWSANGCHTRMQYVDDLLNRFPNAAESTLLELGCGAGTPVLEHLVRKVKHVFANDISNVQLDFARGRCPERTTFLAGDMTALSIEPESLDAVMGFYSVLHLPRDEQPAMLSQIQGWLKEDGLLALNFATADKVEIRGKFFGADMFWSGFPAEKSKQMVEDAGFELLKVEVKTGDDLDVSDPDYGISFLWILAKKSARTSI